jgi:hypothetical protein
MFNIEVKVREIGQDSVDWINLAEDRDWWWILMSMALNLWVP